MALPHESPAYQAGAAVIGRILIGVPFIIGAIFKIPGTEGYTMGVEMTANVGVPLANVAVLLAFILELVAGLAIIVGWHARLAAAVLALYVVLLTVLFHLSFATPQDIGFFVDHLVLIGALLYLSVYGARVAALRPD